MLLGFLAFYCGVVSAGEPAFLETFDAARPDLPADVLVKEPGRSGVLHVAVATGTANPARTIRLSLPVEKLRGNQVFFGAEVKASGVSTRPNPWNGVKVMLVIESPSGKTYPQPDIPDGTLGWQRFSHLTSVPKNATAVTLVLGLEQVTGEAWFDNVRVTLRKSPPPVPPVNAARPIFRGHNLPRLRGAMAGHNLSESDVRHFATEWKGNLLRLQIFEAARNDRSLNEYDTWLEVQLQRIDQVLLLCEKYGVMAVLDLHSPPGGQAFQAGCILGGTYFINNIDIINCINQAILWS